MKENHIEKISSAIVRIDATLTSQAEQLKTHIKRTELLENRFKPIEDIAIAIKGFLKVIAIVGVIATTVEVTIHVTKAVALWLH